MTGKTTTPPDTWPVDIEILLSTYEKAQEQAIRNGDKMAYVARSALRAAGSGTQDAQFRISTLTPAVRPKDAPRKSFRFRMPTEDYNRAANALHAHNKSVARWVEWKLERYAETGQI